MADTNVIDRIKSHADSLESVPHNKQFRADLYALCEAATPPTDAALAAWESLAQSTADDYSHGTSERVRNVLRGCAAALRARAVPEGFVMVPVEPTEEMLSVAVDNWSGYEEESGRFYTPLDSDVRILWNVMLAASKAGEGR